jgi:ATP-dependent Clp protease ATP-binding subunit ClpB
MKFPKMNWQSLQTDLDTLMAIDEAERLHELKWFARQLPNRLSPLLTGQLDANDEEDLETAEGIHNQLNSKLASIANS